MGGFYIFLITILDKGESMAQSCRGENDWRSCRNTVRGVHGINPEKQPSFLFYGTLAMVMMSLDPKAPIPKNSSLP